MKSLADAVFPAEVFSLPLFHGISETGRAALVSSGWLRTCSFEKNQTIYHMGDRVSELGIVLSGSVFVENTDLWGNRSILSKITPGQVFAETYAFCREPMMVNVTAAEASTVLFFNLRNLDQTADGDDAWLSQLRSNMLRISMQKILPSPTAFSALHQRRSASACWSTSPRSLPKPAPTPLRSPSTARASPTT